MILTPLRDYQKEGVRCALQHDGFAFFSEQRTGKCLMSLSVVDARKPDFLLIVCPVKAINVWYSEIKKHWKPSFPCSIKVLNYEQVLIQRGKLRRQIQKFDRPFMIVDESHRIKRRGSKQSKACRSLGKLARYRLALTGTPLSKRDSIEDAWAQFNFIQPKAFGRYADKIDWKTKRVLEVGFESIYLIKGGYKGKKVIGYQKKNFPKFLRIFHKYSFRRTLREVRRAAGIKGLIVRRTRHFVDMSKTNRRHYEELEKKLRTTVNRKTVKVPLIVNLSTKLQQITGGYLLSTPEEDQEAELIKLPKQEKLEALKSLLIAWSRSERIVICARFVHELDEIEAIVRKTGRTVKRISGGNEFDGQFETDVIVIQIQAGLAIDLSASARIVSYSWDYSYVNHEQMRFRVLSYNVRQIWYYYLIVRNSIDELLYEAIVRKKKLADLVCDHYRRK